MKKPMSAAERKHAERERKARAGLVLVQLWVPTASVARVRKYVARLWRERSP